MISKPNPDLRIDVFRSGVSYPVYVRITNTKTGEVYGGHGKTEFEARLMAYAQMPVDELE